MTLYPYTRVPLHFFTSFSAFLAQDYFTELYVENSRGDSEIFKLADLEGSIVFGGANRVLAAEHVWKGIIFGSNFPVSSYYQVENVCKTPSCKTGCAMLSMLLSVGCESNPPPPSPLGLTTAVCGGAGSSTTYSHGTLIMFDWLNGGERVSSIVRTAHFGGKAHMESSWASRGVRLLAR